MEVPYLMRRCIYFFALLMIFLASSTFDAFGEEEKPKGKDEPVDITSDQMEGDRSTQKVVFIGSVVVKQGEMVMNCDKLDVSYKEETRTITDLYATGNVKVVQNEITALADEAFFYRREGKVVLKGNTEVWQGKDVMFGEKITLFLDEDRVIVDKFDGRVHPREKGGIKLEK